MDTREIKVFLDEQVARDEFSGACLIAKDFQVIFEYTAGFANKEDQILNKIDTKFSLGSCNKMFTANAIAQLVEKGLINFTDFVDKYLPDYPNIQVREKVTIHQLLTHTSGFGHYLADKQKFLANRKNLRSIKDFVDFFQDEPLKFEPGSKYDYSGNGFELLGLIIETVSGQSYYQFVKENIFDVAKMPNTESYELNPKDPTLAIGYTKKGDDGGESLVESERRNASFMSLFKGGAGGGGYSTCHDLLNFCQALLQNKLLNPDLTKKVLTPYINLGTKNGQTLYYGYGFQIMDFGDGHLRYGHGGAFAGVSARVDMYPWVNITAVILSNYDEPAAHQIANEIGKLVV